MSSPFAFPLACVCALLAASPLFAQDAAPAATSEEAAPERSREEALAREIAVVLRRARDPGSPERPLLADALARLGGRALDPLLEVLETRRVPASLAEQKPQALSVHQREVLVEGLRRLDATGALRRMDQRLDDSSAAPRRRAALQLYGALGGRERLRRMFELAEPPAGEAFDEGLVATLRGALAELFVREPLAVPRLRSILRSIPVELMAPAVFALGDARDGRGLEFAADAAFAHPELVPLVSAQVAQIGRSPDVSVNARAIDFLSGLRARSEGHVACGLERALAVLEDDRSIQRWIDELDDESEALRSAAHWSLVRISELDYPPDPTLWQVWWDGELDWFDAKYDALLAGLLSPRQATVAASLRELATRRVRRHEIAAEIARMLEDSHAGVRELACDALAELGSVDVLADLTRALRDQDPEVVHAAWRALATLSGRQFAADSAEWDALVAAREP